jgi:hypothetical protein
MDMRFLQPVVPGNRLEMDVQVVKFIQDFAIVEGVAEVDGAMVAKGKLGFARRSLQSSAPPPRIREEGVGSPQPVLASGERML